MGKRPRRTDITGMRSGKLVAVKKLRYETDKSGKRYAIWDCICDCGNHKEVSQHLIVSGSVKSCGCLRKRDYSIPQSYHGMSRSRIYKTYHNMIDRCTNEKDQHFPNYGGRGITVCKEWMPPNGFKNFYKWAIESGYADSLTIDRIDVNGNYDPANCRWATNTEQQNNKRNNRLYLVDNEYQTARQISDRYGINIHTFWGRMRQMGLSAQEAVYYKPDRITVTYNGITHTIEEWSKITGLSERVLRERLKRGYSVSELFTPLWKKRR